MRNKVSRLLLVFAIVVLLLNFANAATMSYVPRVYLAGYTGAHKNLLGKADILAPLLLTENNNLFAYAQGKTAYEARTWEDSTYTGSLALGFRQIVKDTTALGAYVFGDYTNSTSGHIFEVISPGIESLSRAWDFRTNGYFPIGTKRWVDEGWASEFGDNHYIDLTGHNQYDHWYQYYQEVGPGADAEIGRNLFMLKGKVKGILFKGFLNGYYYDMKHNDDVIGGGARLIIQPSPAIKISLRDSYDNYEHNTFMMGVQLSFYDLIAAHRSDPVDIQDLQRNLFVPIERNLGTIGLGSSIPVTQSDRTEDLGQRLEHDGVWFFKQGVTAGNAVQGTGTYEDPFTAFTMEEFDYVNSHYQSIGATIDPFPLLYFNSGTYPLTDFGDRFGVPAGWGMYGWVMYDTPINHPAMQTQRPVFVGGIDLLQGNNTLDSIAIHNNSGNQSYGLGIQANNINLNNIEVGALNNTTGYQTGIMIDGANNVNLNQSQVYGFSAAPITRFAQVYGIDIKNCSILTLGDNNIVSSQTYGGNFGDISSGNVIVKIFAYGLHANNSTVTIIGSENIISGTATGESFENVSDNGENVSVKAFATANGFDLNNSTLTISGSENNISGTATGGTIGNVAAVGESATAIEFATANGLDADNSTVTISGNGNTISGTGIGGTVGNASGAVYVSVEARVSGLYATMDGSTVTLSGNENTISATATGGSVITTGVGVADNDGEAYGISVRNGATLDIIDTATNTNITVNGSTSSWGIFADDDVDTHLKSNGADILAENAYDALVTYTKLGATGDGHALEWQLKGYVKDW